MKKININNFKSILDYLALTKKSNTINSWLLGINSAILIFFINRFIEPSDFLTDLLTKNIYLKFLSLLLFIWLSLNVVLLILYTYKERILSLTIEDKFFRLKAFISFIDDIDDISENELLDKDIYEIQQLTNNPKTKQAIKEYTDGIHKYYNSILKWSNKRFLIYRIVILVSIPLLIASYIVVLSSF